MDAKSLITAYYDAFNAGQTDRMLDMLHDEVEHHVNEGQIRRGKGVLEQLVVGPHAPSGFTGVFDPA